MSGYRGAHALVVGGLGFIGAHLSRTLGQLGARVTIVTPSIERHYEAAEELVERGMRIVEGDMRDDRTMQAAVAGQQIVFNLAGQSGAVQSLEEPRKDLDVNVRGNLVLLDTLRTHNRDATVIFASSRLAYGRTGAEPVREDRPPAPTSIHAVHKVAVEQYLHLHGRLYGLRYAIARLTNPYGPGQPRERTAYGIVNRLIHLALADETLTVYGDGLQRRDYIYVDDAVEALLALGASKACAGQVYNVGSGAGTTIAEMARIIVDIAGGGRVASAPWPALAERVETGDFVADVAKIARDAGWQPRTPLRDGLEKTVAFYKAHAA